MRTLLLVFALAAAVSAQTSAFTYQGRLTDNMLAANGTYDFQFSLYDSAIGGTQIGAQQTIVGVIVVNGIFQVELDFGSAAFDGGERFLEIAVKRPSDTSYTVLIPRQRITSAPYAVRSQQGSAGLTTLIRTSVESPGANCATGGMKAEFGLDANGNGVLDGNEVNAAMTRYVCNGAVGPQGQQGQQGATGPQGPSGSLAAYGDGSAGSLTVSSGNILDLTTPAGYNSLAGRHHLQFTNINIAGELRVPSGVTLRATGTVTISGTIRVSPGTESGHPGVALSSAALVQGGKGLSLLSAAQIVRISSAGGGAGFRTNIAVNTGGEGGGAFSIFAQGGINITSSGSILANGSDGVRAVSGNVAGSGGGAGGVIVLASKSTITVAGNIRANGGKGADGFDSGGTADGGGGGGGGGIVHLIATSAPSVTGSIQVNGGAGGLTAGTVTTSITPGGGGGGAGGSGGNGANFQLSGTYTAAQPGQNGLYLTTVVPSPENLKF